MIVAIDRLKRLRSCTVFWSRAARVRRRYEGLYQIGLVSTNGGLASWRRLVGEHGAAIMIWEHEVEGQVEKEVVTNLL